MLQDQPMTSCCDVMLDVNYISGSICVRTMISAEFVRFSESENPKKAVPMLHDYPVTF